MKKSDNTVLLTMVQELTKCFHKFIPSGKSMEAKQTSIINASGSETTQVFTALPETTMDVLQQTSENTSGEAVQTCKNVSKNSHEALISLLHTLLPFYTVKNDAQHILLDSTNHASAGNRSLSYLEPLSLNFSHEKFYPIKSLLLLDSKITPPLQSLNTCHLLTQELQHNSLNLNSHRSNLSYENIHTSLNSRSMNISDESEVDTKIPTVRSFSNQFAYTHTAKSDQEKILRTSGPIYVMTADQENNNNIERGNCNNKVTTEKIHENKSNKREFSLSTDIQSIKIYETHVVENKGGDKTGSSDMSIKTAYPTSSSILIGVEERSKNLIDHLSSLLEKSTTNYPLNKDSSIESASRSFGTHNFGYADINEYNQMKLSNTSNELVDFIEGNESSTKYHFLFNDVFSTVGFFTNLERHSDLKKSGADNTQSQEHLISTVLSNTGIQTDTPVMKISQIPSISGPLYDESTAKMPRVFQAKTVTDFKSTLFARPFLKTDNSESSETPRKLIPQTAVASLNNLSLGKLISLTLTSLTNRGKV